MASECNPGNNIIGYRVVLEVYFGNYEGIINIDKCVKCVQIGKRVKEHL